MKTYSLAVIGCGYIGQQHIADLFNKPDITVKAVVDTDLQRAAAVAQKYNVETFTDDYKTVLADESIDLVIIATWVRSHVSILKDCIAAGKHVLCEKPLSAGEEETREAFSVIEKAKTKVQLALILRHNATYQAAKALLDSGIIGKITMVRMVQNHHAMAWERYRNLLEDCPSYFDCGVHYFDVFSWFTGSPVVSVSARETFLNHEIAHANYGLVQMRNADGCLGIYEAGWSPNLPASNEKLFVGEKGYLKIILERDRTENHEEGDLIQLYTADDGNYQSFNRRAVYKNMYAQVKALIQSIETDSETTPSLQEASAATAVAFAAVKSAQTGKEIQL